MNKYETWDKLKEPAPVVNNKGTKYWYDKDGRIHRENGPAVIRKDGSEYWYWYLHGAWHRDNGPAVTRADGSKEWCLNDLRYTEDKFNEQIRNME